MSKLQVTEMSNDGIGLEEQAQQTSVREEALQEIQVVLPICGQYIVDITQQVADLAALLTLCNNKLKEVQHLGD